MKSNDLSDVDGQQELAIAPKVEKIDVSLDLIKQQATFAQAINLCITLSGLDDKVIYIPLQIDAGHWSRMRKGDAHFPLNKLNQLMDMCGNEVPLIWLANQRGYELKKLLTTLESELEQERIKNQRLEDKLILMQEIMGVKQ